MEIFYRSKVVLLLIGSLLLITESFATNGYFAHGYGIRYKGMAGVGVSMFQSSFTSAINPAGMVFLGKRYDVGISFFNPNREFTVTGNPSGFPGTFGLAPGTVESDNKLFIIPELGANWLLGEDNSVGVAIYGNGGMNTEYPQAIFGASSPVGVNLSQLFVNVSYARKLVENHSVGISLIFATQFFEATGLEAFSGFSINGAAVTNNGSDTGTGFGLRIGYQGELAEGLRFGASYQSEIKMSEFDDYAGLFAEQGDFDIPATWTAGLSYNFGGTFTAALDVQQILYSDIKSVANPIVNLLGGAPLGTDNGGGFGWRDMTVMRIGAEYTGMESWKIRGGFSFALDEQPIPETEMNFNILAPGVIESHASLGISKMIGGKNELSFAITHAFSKSVTGPNMMEAPGQQSIEIKMDQWDIGLGFSF